MGLPVNVDGKAVEEVGKILEQSGLTGLANSVLGFATDFVSEWRSRNILRYHDRWERVRRQRQIEGKVVVPPTLLLPALRAVSETDDDDLLQLWANLMTDCEVTDRDTAASKVLVGTLMGMQPLDARLLMHLITPSFNNLGSPDEQREKVVINVGVHVADVSSVLNVGADRIEFSAANLVRLGCLIANQHEPFTYLVADDPVSPVSEIGKILHGIRSTYHLTELALLLVNAIRPAPHDGA